MAANATNETSDTPLDQAGHGVYSFRVLKEKKISCYEIGYLVESQCNRQTEETS
jgi:hypothetical protein